MTRTAPDRPAVPGAASRSGIWPLVLVVAITAAYLNSFQGPFVFDDVPAIAENEALREFSFRSLLGIGQPGGLTTSGRPVLSLTLALNWWFSGSSVGSYHAVNLAVHLAASLCLFGLVRRTLLMPVMRGTFGAAAGPIAFSVALLWALHPLQTESVTYLVQRAESLAGLFYLLSLYAFVRSVEAASPARWRVVAAVACFLGVGTKEVVATLPIVLWCYDRTFVSGTFHGAWRRNRPLYLTLAGSWLVLAGLMAITQGRGGTAGFATEMTPWAYAVTQCGALVRYLGLSAWPEPLIFDHGIAVVRRLREVLPQAFVVIALLAATAFALVRTPVAGFLGVWFFALLAPSSSVIPIVTQTAAEHRMYLPLAALIMAVVGAVYRFAGDRVLWWSCAVGLSAMGLTVARNADYRSELSIWRDTATKHPTSARAHNNYGRELYKAGDVRGAIAEYEKALILQPKYPETHYNLGVALAGLGELNQAIERYGRAIEFDRNYPEAHNNLGNALVGVGRVDEAVPHYQRAFAIKPAFAEAHNNLGNAYLQRGQMEQARREFERALQLRPHYAEARFNLGNLQAASGDMKAAIASYDEALRLKPGYLEAQINKGNAALARGDSAAAIDAYRRAIAIEPNSVDAHFNLASTFLDLERWAEAIPHLETAVRVKRDYAPAYRALGFAEGRVGRLDVAISAYEKYLSLLPNEDAARAELRELISRRAGRP